MLCIVVINGYAQERKDGARIQVAGKIDIARLADVVAAISGVPIEYDGALLRGEFVLRNTDGLGPDELGSVLRDALASRGLTTIAASAGKRLRIVRVQDAPSLAPIWEAADVRRQSIGLGTPGFVSVRIRVAHAPVPLVVRILEEAGTKGAGSVRAIERAREVILGDTAERLPSLLELVDAIDVPSESPRVVAFDVRDLGADEAKRRAEQLAPLWPTGHGTGLSGIILPVLDGSRLSIVCPSSEDEAWRSVIDMISAPDESFAVAYPIVDIDEKELRSFLEQARPGRDDPRWRYVSDRIGQAALITATRGQHAFVDETLRRIRELPAEARRSSRTFQVQNRSASELVGVLHRLMDTQYSTAEQPAAAEMSPGEGAPAGRGSVSLTGDEVTNSIIATGPPSEIARVSELVRELDVRQPQVQLEVVLISLSEGQTRDLGVQLAAVFDGGGTLFGLASLFGISPITPGSTSPLGSGAGGTAVAIGPGDYAAVIRALETINSGRTLSRPRVIVNNNQQARINSVVQQPFVSTNASDTVATTSFGGTSDAGTQVRVRPQIAKSDSIVLEYDISLSAFVGEAASASVPPPRQQTSFSSSATIPDGYTIVLGGIELTTAGEAVDQTPPLAWIPVFGELFKNRSKSSSRSRFYVFINATVLRAPDCEDLRYISDVGVREAMLDDGWPETSPRVIR